MKSLVLMLLLTSCAPIAYSRDDRSYPRYAFYQKDFDPPTTSSREIMDEVHNYCRNSTYRNCVMDRVYYICITNVKLEASVCKQARKVTKIVN